MTTARPRPRHPQRPVHKVGLMAGVSKRGPVVYGMFVFEDSTTFIGGVRVGNEADDGSLCFVGYGT